MGRQLNEVSLLVLQGLWTGVDHHVPPPRGILQCARHESQPDGCVVDAGHGGGADGGRAGVGAVWGRERWVGECRVGGSEVCEIWKGRS